MKRSLHDQWIEPQRAPLIPKFNEIKDLALQQNCICCSISGAGPSIFALFESEKSAIEFGQASVAHYSSKQLMATFYASPINKVGCKEIKS